MANIRILFEDNHLLVVDKPSGLLTQPTALEADCLVSRLKKQQGITFLEPIHRIDRVTSGIVVLAKTSKALSRLMEALRKKTCSKQYIALVEKRPNPPEGMLEDLLEHGSFRAIKGEGPKAKKALLTYQLKGKKGPFYRLVIQIETGRYHQIRAQLSAIGCPIVGDKKYGSSKPFKEKAIALHHQMMTIPHPISGEMMTFTAAPWNE